MDCLQAREIVSEAFDRGVAATVGVEEARTHCRGCADCRRFVEGLVALQKAPQPTAPPQLIEDVLGRVRLAALADADEEAARAAAGITPRATEPDPETAAILAAAAIASSAAPAAPTASGAPVAGAARPTIPFPAAPTSWEPDIAAKAPARPRPPYWWVPRVSAVAAAAAVVVVAVVVGMRGFSALGGHESARSATSTIVAPLAGSAAPQAHKPDFAVGTTDQGAEKGASSTAGSASLASSVQYVSYLGVAYVGLGSRTPDQASIKSVGTALTSLDSSAPATPHQVWQSSLDPNVIFIQQANGGWLVFTRITRHKLGKTFYLTAEGDILAFGVWPTLPPRFTTPTNADGTPTFQNAGKDDTGLTVYSPPGTPAEKGFAVAPGSVPAEMGGGNPNWTWWAPAN
jgi:hypothetical protein